jgi:hypothetical protein
VRELNNLATKPGQAGQGGKVGKVEKVDKVGRKLKVEKLTACHE